MSTTVIATLGRSPGAVTGFVRALHHKHPDLSITHLSVLHTDHPDIHKAYNLVADYVRTYDPRIEVSKHKLNEPDHTRVGQFYRLVTQTIQQHVDAKQQIVIGIAGARTSMSTLLALGAQLFEEVSHIYHMWVIDKLAKNGDIDNLNKLKNRRTPDYEGILAPREGEYQLVPMPHHLLVEKYAFIQGKASLDLDREPDRAVINQVLQLLPGRMTIDGSRELVAVIERIRKGESPQTQITNLVDLFEGEGYPILDRRQFETLLELGAQLPMNEAILKWTQQLSILQKSEGVTQMPSQFERHMLDFTKMQAQWTRITGAAAVFGMALQFMGLLLQAAKP